MRIDPGRRHLPLNSHRHGATRPPAPRFLLHGALLVLALGAAVYSGVIGTPPFRPAIGEHSAGAVYQQDAGLTRSLNGDPVTGPAHPQGAQQQINPIEAVRLGQPNFGAFVAGGLCEAADGPYCIYAVQEGDTLSGIAETFGLNGGVVPGWELLAASNKPDIVDIDDFIQPGQKLRVPLGRGVVHTILLGETVGDLAEQFDVTSAQIIAANALADPDLLQTGQVLFIPDPNKLPSPELPDSSPAPAAEAEPSGPKPWIWPITASTRITNYMSARHPLGIDLGLGHAPGSPIVAVADGVVEFAGGNACCSYGLYVIIDHGNGLKTLYAHLAALEVAKGQRVEQGQRLGPSGRTGYSTGVHLHFEVHQDGSRRNPMNYLP